MNGAKQSSLVGDGESELHEQTLRALEVVHDPRSSNVLRQDASRYLEELRSHEEAPYQGFKLASAGEQPAIVRHYGLSLLDYAVRHRWAEYSPEQAGALRDWIATLADNSTKEDPAYIINKVAEIWVEVAKRSWGLEWMNMDEQLFALWSRSVTQKILVLAILETLSEEIFGNDDTIAAFRGSDLNKACVEVFTPADVLAEHFPTRDNIVSTRYGKEGWLSRMAEVLGWCIGDGQLDEERQAAVDALYSLYNRPRFSEDDFRDLVGPMFQDDTLNLLKQLYQWLNVDPSNIDEAKYLLLKKFSEMIFNIGRLLEERPSFITNGSNLGGFFDLLLNIMKNDSLHVSIPALHLWVKLLSSDQIGNAPAVITLVGELLDTCSRRLIRFEALPDDSSNASIIFLNEDVDTMPEKHAFLGNYARFCNQIVELVVQKQPIDALYHILGEADQVLDHIYDAEPAFLPSTYTKTSIPLLRIDAQFTVIEAALKGCLKWLTSSVNPTSEHEHEVMTSNLQVWCDRLLSLIFEDPSIKQRVIQLAVGFAIGPLKRNARFAFKIFDYILDTKCSIIPGCESYNDAVKDLQAFSLHQLQRLAMRFPDQLVTIFDEVEKKIMSVSQTVAADEQTRSRYSSVLFIIMHRATSVDFQAREARLEQFLQPLMDQWQNPNLTQSLSSFDSFSRLLGLENLPQYLSSRAVHKIPEWSSQPLDDEGKILQAQMQNALDALPLRATKTIMSVSVERLEEKSQPFEMACRLWHKNLPLILPNLLQFISQSQAFHDSSYWTGLPLEMQDIVRRILTDRFWQVGISQGSRDDFYARVGDTKTTMEGFASSIRATVRTIRETGYRLLYYMSLLGEHFYSFEDLPGPLARALFTDACALSPHQMAMLVDSIRPIIENCPEASRKHFLPPILSALFQQLDRKASTEWEKIEQRNKSVSEDDDLTDEMKNESILRQLTMASVMLVVALLEPARPRLPAEKVDRSVRHLLKAQHDSRRQRAIVLDLLEGFRGVAINEQGKLPRPDPKKLRSAMQEKYMTVEVQANEPKDKSPDLGGIADMFGR
ncbi:exportin-5, partial [Lecanoromycetidae sp. Uapishka_2]